MDFSKSDIENLPRVKRLNIINSVSGIKPGNLIATQSNSGQSNLAIFSSIVHLGSNPALLGFIIRPTDEIRRDTYNNILENGCFTVNHIHASFIEQAHYTSAKFEQSTSEFDACGFTEEFLFDFKVPFVKESHLKMALRHVESVPVQSNQTQMIVGQIEHLVLPDSAVDEKGYIDLGAINDIGISGLNRYYALDKIGEFPYARVEELPDFKKS